MVIGVSLVKGPSPHLTWQELSCKDGTTYPERFVIDGRVFRVAQMFEAIRLFCGEKPLKILSAYRTPSHNRKIGGARFSQHVEGRALDLKPPKGMSVEMFFSLIKSGAEAMGIGGIGLYKTFVHVDIRSVDRLVVWSGNGIKDSGTRA